MRNQRLMIVGMATAAALLLLNQSKTGGFYPADAESGDDETIIDTIGQTMDQVIGSVAPGPAAEMWASDDVRGMLKRREALRLERYNLGDGGWTIGYGHFETDISKVPARITVDDADRIFDNDVAERAEKWVRLYVRVPVTQYEFDALVHIAFNMSPKSFKKFADAVNAGEGIVGMAQRSISWVADKFKNGISNRRNEEIALFNEGQYA